MKKNLILAGLLLCTWPAAGQPAPGDLPETRRWTYAATAGAGIPMNAPRATPFLLGGSVYHHITPRIWCGASTGIAAYDRTVLIPLRGTVRWEITRPHRIVPFLECGAGYGFAPARKVEGGLSLAPAAGIHWRLTSRMGMQAAVGYERQHLTRLRTRSDRYFTYQTTEALRHSSLTLTVGLLF